VSGVLGALAGALALFALVGALLDRALFARGPRGAFERSGRALLLGMLVTGACSMALDALGLRVGRGSLAIALALVALPCLLALRRRPRTPAPPAAESPRGSAALAHHALVAVALLALLWPIVAGLVLPPFQFDALTRWLLKTKVLAVEGTLRGAVSSDPDFGFSHQRYPPLVAHVANVPALIAGRWDARAAEGLFPWFAVAAVLLAYGAVARRADRLRGALAAAWIATLPLLCFLPRPPPGSGAFSAMADVPLAAFVLAGGLALLDALEGVRDRAHLEAALLLAGAALTKNEGLPLLAGAAVAILVGARRARLRRVLGVAGVAALLYALLWWTLARHFPALDEDYAGHASWAALVAGLPRLSFILPAFGAELFSFQRWGLTWIVAAALLALGRPRRALLGLLLLVLAQLLVYVLMFVISAWTSPAGEALAASGDPVEYLLTITLGRLFLHLAPLVVALACASAPPLIAREAGVPEPRPAG
jgi:hypothetical protein